MQVENLFTAISPSQTKNSGKSNEGNVFELPKQTSGTKIKNVVNSEQKKSTPAPSVLKNSNSSSVELNTDSAETASNMTVADFIEAMKSFLNKNSDLLGVSDKNLSQINAQLDEISESLDPNLLIGDILNIEQVKLIFSQIQSLISFNSIDIDNTAMLKKGIQNLSNIIDKAQKALPKSNLASDPILSVTKPAEPSIAVPTLENGEAAKPLKEFHSFSIEIKAPTNTANTNANNTQTSGLADLIKGAAANNSGNSSNSGFSGHNFSSEITASLIDTIQNDSEAIDKLNFEKLITQSEEKMNTPTENGRRQISQIIFNQITTSLKREGNKITIELAPRSLGDIEISLEKENGTMKAVVKADNPQTLDILRSDRNAIIEILKQNGFDDKKQDLIFEEGDSSNNKNKEENNNNGNSENSSYSEEGEEELTTVKQIIDNDTLDILA